MQTRRKHKQMMSEEHSLNTTSSCNQEGLLMSLLINLNIQDHNQEQIPQQNSKQTNIHNINPSIKRQIDYSQCYENGSLQDDLIDLSNSLSNHNISPLSRGKLIDWMHEVFSVCSQSTQTFFRTINLLDAYLKQTQNIHSDQDLYLIGITLIFISSKLEEIYHITLGEIAGNLGHNRYSQGQIKDMEQTILEGLQYNLYFPTTLEYLDYIYIQSMGLNSQEPEFHNIYETSLYILKMVIHDYHFMQYNNMLLASSVFGYVLKEFILVHNNRINALLESQLLQTQNTIISIARVPLNAYLNCLEDISQLTNQFSVKFPQYQKLQIYN